MSFEERDGIGPPFLSSPDAIWATWTQGKWGKKTTERLLQCFLHPREGMIIGKRIFGVWRMKQKGKTTKSHLGSGCCDEPRNGPGSQVPRRLESSTYYRAPLSPGNNAKQPASSENTRNSILSLIGHWERSKPVANGSILKQSSIWQIDGLWQGKKESKRWNKDAIFKDWLAVRISLFSMAKEPVKSSTYWWIFFYSRSKSKGPVLWAVPLEEPGAWPLDNSEQGYRAKARDSRVPVSSRTRDGCKRNTLCFQFGFCDLSAKQGFTKQKLPENPHTFWLILVVFLLTGISCLPSHSSSMSLGSS